MYNETIHGNTEPTGVLGILIMMLPLLLVVAVMVTIFGKKRNERKQSRIGVELEMIRKDGHRSDSIGSHARAIGSLLTKIRRVQKTKVKDMTPSDKDLYDRLRHHVHQRYQLTKRQWSEYAKNTRIKSEIVDEGYSHRVIPTHHKLVPDGSLNHGGQELVTAPLIGKDISPAVQEVSFIARHGNGVDASCGTHLHNGLEDPELGFNGASHDRQWWMMRMAGCFNLIYSYFQPVIDSMVSASRRGRKTYTAPLPPYFDRRVTNGLGAQANFGTAIQGRRNYGNQNPYWQENLKGEGRKPNLTWGIFERDDAGAVKASYFAVDPSLRPNDAEYEINDYGNLVPIQGSDSPHLMTMTGAQAARKWNANVQARALSLQAQGYPAQRVASKLQAQMGFKVTAFDLACITAYNMQTGSGVLTNRDDAHVEAVTQHSPHQEANGLWGEDPEGKTVLRFNNAVWPAEIPSSERCHHDPRYTHVNPYSLQKYGTLEVRQHQGMLNPTKVLMWSELMDLFLNEAARAVESPRGLRLPNTGDDFFVMMKWLGFDKNDEFTQMWRRRISVINNDGYNKEHALTCTTCGLYNCDRDNACGPLPMYEIEDEHGMDVFIANFNPTCHDCGSHLSDMMYSDDAEFTDHDEDQATCWCDECEEDRHFSMDSTWVGLLAGLVMGVVSPAALLVGCGIGLIHAAGNKWRFTNRLKTKWIKLQTRGSEASGVGYLKASGKTGMVKAPLSAEAMVKRSKAKGFKGKSLEARLTDTTIAAWLHTRFSTHGDNNSENAHPHFGPNKYISLVHNGVVHNYDRVYEALEIEPLGPVDSQAVAAALEIGGIEKVVETCEGSMSLIWHDKRDPVGTVKFWTNGGNPLAFGRVDDAKSGPVAVASTMDILEESWALPDKVIKNHPKTGRRLRKKQWKYVKQTRLASAYSCTIGREYTIHADGKITHRDIAGSARTAHKTYDWRTYASTYSGYNYPAKAKGDADNCALPDQFLKITTKTKHYGIDMDEVLAQAWDIIDYETITWPPFQIVTYDGLEVSLDGYDGLMGQGVREYGDGSLQRYNIPESAIKVLDEDWKNDHFEDVVWSMLVGHYYDSHQAWTSATAYSDLWYDL